MRDSDLRLTERAPEAKGWPRRWIMWKPRSALRPSTGPALKPVPWINGRNPVSDNDWLCFEEERSVEAYFERACVVCGERMEGAIVFGAYQHQRQTAGPGGHPRCLLLAVKTCPHLMYRESGELVAWLYCGDSRGHTCRNALDNADVPYSAGEQDIDPCAVPLTVDELVALVKRDSLGIETEGPRA